MADFIAKLIAFLFAQDKKNHPISQERDEKLQALWSPDKGAQNG